MRGKGDGAVALDDNFKDRGYARLAGHVLNARNVENEQANEAEIAPLPQVAVSSKLYWHNTPNLVGNAVDSLLQRM